MRAQTRMHTRSPESKRELSRYFDRDLYERFESFRLPDREP